jgi:hypothetical protein
MLAACDAQLACVLAYGGTELHWRRWLTGRGPGSAESDIVMFALNEPNHTAMTCTCIDIMRCTVICVPLLDCVVMTQRVSGRSRFDCRAEKRRHDVELVACLAIDGQLEYWLAMTEG